MKNRWVQIKKGGKTCYGQVEDAGPARYNDANYVFGTTDDRPQNRDMRCGNGCQSRAQRLPRIRIARR